MKLTFDRSAAEFVLTALQTHEVKPLCAACNGDITPDNFAGAVGAKLYCNQLPCIIAVTRIDKEQTT